MDHSSSIGTQRLDKWLWFARLIKTRSQASKLVSAGKVRINRVKTTKPSATVGEGDVITAVIHNRVRVLKVLGPGNRRGPAPEAQELYEDLTPAEELVSKTKSNTREDLKSKPVSPAAAPSREKGMGRPTKKDRRRMAAFQEASEQDDTGRG